MNEIHRCRNTWMYCDGNCTNCTLNSIDANLIKNGTIGDEIVVKALDINVGDLISRRAVIKDICDLPNCENGYSDTYDKACLIAVLEEQLPIDAVPVVRCKDCKHYRESKVLSPQKFCFRLKDRGGKEIGYNFAEDDFCSYGERNEK